MHRFYMFHSLTRFHQNAIASAALFLSAKVEEQPRTLDQVIIVGWTLLCRDYALPGKMSTRYLEQLEDLVFHEDVLLQTLGFDLAVEHPHTHILSCSHLIEASKDLVEASYFMASNSLQLTTMCLLHKPTVVACFCIHITSEWSNCEIQQNNDGKPWFWHIDSSVTEQQLRQITIEFLCIFDKCSPRLKRKITSKLGNQSFILNSRYSPYSRMDGDAWREQQSCSNRDSTFQSSSAFLSKDRKRPLVSSSSSLSRPFHGYRENTEKKERTRPEREKSGAVDIATNASTVFTVIPPRKSHLSDSHHAQQKATSSEPSLTPGKNSSGPGANPKMHHNHCNSLPSQRHSSSTSSCDHDMNSVNLASRNLIYHHDSQSKKARIIISYDCELSISSIDDALNIEKVYQNPEQHEKTDRRSDDLRNKILDNRCKSSVQKEYEKYEQKYQQNYQQQQQYKTHWVSRIDASAHNPTKPTITTNSRDEPSSVIGRSSPSSMASEIKRSERMRSFETEPMGRQTSLTNASKTSKHEDLLSVTTPDSGFGTQPLTNFRDCLSPTKTTQSISALLQEPLVVMPSLLLGITDSGAAETSSQSSRQRDETSITKNLRAPRRSQVEHRDGTSAPIAIAINRTKEKKVLRKKKEASDPSRASSTNTPAEITSKWRKFAHNKSGKKKVKKPKSEIANSMSSMKRNVSSRARTRSQDKASSRTVAGLTMKMPMKRLRETASHRIQGSVKMEIRALDDVTSSSMARSCSSSLSRSRDPSRSGSDGSAVAPLSNRRLQIHD